MRLIFMGTPEIAVNSLKELAKNYDVIAVYSQPDRPAGRGKKLIKPAVKIAAENLGIEVFQPESLKKEDNTELLKSLKPDIIVVMAYGQILSKKVLEIPKFGCINIHASLLPFYRGAAPIQWAIINGEKETGVTIMKMDIGLDTGDMIYKLKIQIEEKDNALTLHEKISDLGAKAIIEALPNILNNTAVYEKQPKEFTYAPMLTKEMGEIDWNQNSEDIINKIRGMYIWPVAYTKDSENILKIYEARKANGIGKPGEVIEKEKRLIIGTKNGSIEILKIQPPTKKVMDAKAFLLGNKIGDYLC